jgi:hypothetical protein
MVFSFALVYRSTCSGLVQGLLEILVIGPHLLLEQLRPAGDSRVHARLCVLRRDDKEAAFTLVKELAENDKLIWPHCAGLIWPHPGVGQVLATPFLARVLVSR